MDCTQPIDFINILCLFGQFKFTISNLAGDFMKKIALKPES